MQHAQILNFVVVRKFLVDIGAVWVDTKRGSMDAGPNASFLRTVILALAADVR